MKKLALLLAFVCALAGAQTFPVQNLTVGGTSSFTGTMSGAGLTNYLASPPAIGSSAANTGSFTTLATSGTHTASGASVLNGTVSGTGLSTYEANINHVQTVLNIAALRALNCVSGLVYSAQGYYTLGDGGGGALYVCNSGDTSTADNGGTILAAANTFRLYMMPPSQYNARQFGMKCDGATDDTTALQAAVTASVGHSLYIPAGTKGNGAPFNQNPCLISAPITLTSTVGGYNIFGDSPEWSTANGNSGGTIIKNTSVTGTDAFQVTSAANGQVLISKFAILGNGSDGNGITLSGAFNTIIEKMTIAGIGKAGVSATNSFNSHVYQSLIGNIKQDGIFWNGLANGISVRDSVFFNCDTAHGGYGEIRITGAGGNSLAPVVEGNTFEGGANTEFGLILTGTNGATVKGNYFEVIPTLLYSDTTVSGFSYDSNYFQDGLVTIAGSTNGAFTNNVVAKNTITTTATITTSTGGNNVFAHGNVATGGATISIPASSGTATLVAGTATVSNLNVNSGIPIMISRATAAGTVGDLRLGTVTNGSSFIINSASSTDTSTVNWSFGGY